MTLLLIAAQCWLLGHDWSYFRKKMKGKQSEELSGSVNRYIEQVNSTGGFMVDCRRCERCKSEECVSVVGDTD